MDIKTHQYILVLPIASFVFAIVNTSLILSEMGKYSIEINLNSVYWTASIKFMFKEEESNIFADLCFRPYELSRTILP